MIHLDLSLVQGDKNGSICIFLHARTPVEAAPFVEKAIFFPLDAFRSFVEDQVTIGVLVHFWVFNPIPFIHLPDIVPIPCSFYYYCSVVMFEVWDMGSSRSSFTVENSFSYPGFFVIPDEFENCSF